MKIIKFQTMDLKTVYVNAEEISFFYYNNGNVSYVGMNNNQVFKIAGNIVVQLAKLITASTNGTMLILE